MVIRAGSTEFAAVRQALTQLSGVGARSWVRSSTIPMRRSPSTGGTTTTTTMGPRSSRTILIISQVYVPDPSSLGQHMADAAAELVRRGHRVVVFTSASGFEDPSARYPSREIRDGVEIRRLPFSSFGKGNIAIRLLGAGVFLSQAVARGILIRGLDTVVVSTSPPMGCFAGAMLRAVRRIRLVFWLTGRQSGSDDRDGSHSRGILDGARVQLARSRRPQISRPGDRARPLHGRAGKPQGGHPREGGRHPTVAARRLRNGDSPCGQSVPAGARADGEVVVMYSGNHSPSNPVSTLLAAARRLRDEPRLVFLFVGGGAGKREVEAAMAGAPDIRSTAVPAARSPRVSRSRPPTFTS